MSEKKMSVERRVAYLPRLWGSMVTLRNGFTAEELARDCDVDLAWVERCLAENPELVERLPSMPGQPPRWCVPQEKVRSIIAFLRTGDCLHRCTRYEVPLGIRAAISTMTRSAETPSGSSRDPELLARVLNAGRMHMHEDGNPDLTVPRTRAHVEAFAALESLVLAEVALARGQEAAPEERQRLRQLGKDAALALAKADELLKATDVALRFLVSPIFCP